MARLAFWTFDTGEAADTDRVVSDGWLDSSEDALSGRPFRLDSGMIELQFALRDRSAPVTLLARRSADAALSVGTTEAGAVRVSQQAGAALSVAMSPPDWVDPGRTLRLRLIWDAGSGGALHLADPATGAQHSQPIESRMSMSFGGEGWILAPPCAARIDHLGLWDAAAPTDDRPPVTGTLDLTGAGALRVVYGAGAGSVGTVTFFDRDGNRTGTLDFPAAINVVPCFTPDTMIATPKGERRVIELRRGDEVITRDNGLQKIRWTSERSLGWRDLDRAPHLRPIWIRRGALGDGLPERDMMVSPNHRLLVDRGRSCVPFDEPEVFVAAKHLVNHRDIVPVSKRGVTYMHFMCDRHEVVLSDGAWTESFQPNDRSLRAVGNAQRTELLELFPELGRPAPAYFPPARRQLTRREARMLLTR